MFSSPQIRESVRGDASEIGRSSGAFDRILLAVDAEIDPSLIETTVSVARAFDASIHALSVVPMRASVDHWDFAVERREAEAERALDRVGDAANDITVAKRLRYGDPSEEIELYAEHNGIDLIVAGEPEKSRLRRFLSPRSVTESLQRSASVPVLAVPASDAPVEPGRDHPAPRSRRTAVPGDD